MIKNYIAVYGTLKSGMPNHGYIESGKLQYAGCAVSKTPSYFLQGGGAFPFLFKPDVDFPVKVETSRVRVELYEFEDFEQIKSIDLLEGHPNWYERQEEWFYIEGSNTLVKAWVYIAKQPNREFHINKIRVNKNESYVEWL